MYFSATVANFFLCFFIVCSSRHIITIDVRGMQPRGIAHKKPPLPVCLFLHVNFLLSLTSLLLPWIFLFACLTSFLIAVYRSSNFRFCVVQYERIDVDLIPVPLFAIKAFLWSSGVPRRYN